MSGDDSKKRPDPREPLRESEEGEDRSGEEQEEEDEVLDRPILRPQRRADEDGR